MVKVQLQCSDGSVAAQEVDPSLSLEAMLAQFEQAEIARVNSGEIAAARHFAQWFGVPPVEEMGPKQSGST